MTKHEIHLLVVDRDRFRAIAASIVETHPEEASKLLVSAARLDAKIEQERRALRLGTRRYASRVIGGKRFFSRVR